MLFPQLGPQYYDERDRSILGKMEAFYAEAITINQSYWNEADADHRFESGDQSVWNDVYGNLAPQRRRQYSFNRIRPITNMISGYQRRNRKSSVVIPIENGDAETADQFTKILLWINQQEGVLETVSEAFQGGLISGMNLLRVWIDFRSDPLSGNIKVDNMSYNSFIIDPFFKKADLSDCNGIWIRSFLTKRDVISLLPEYSDEIIGLIQNTAGTGRDGKFQFMPQSYGYAYTNLLTYDEYYYRDYRTQLMLVDKQTGETQEWKGTKDERLNEFLRAYPTLTTMEQEIPTVNVAIVVQGKVMYDGPNPLGIDCYPFVPVFSYYRPEMPYFPWRITSVVRGLRDAQYLYNRRVITSADILESQVNSGWVFKENALVNPADVWNLTGQGRGIAIKEEAQMTDVQRIEAPQIPPSMFQLAETFAKEIQLVSGVNEELLGSAMDDKAGVLSMLRQGAGLTTLQPLFDQLDRAQKLLYKIMLDVIQTNFMPGKVKKILEGVEPTAQFYNKAFGRYDIAIEDGLNTSTQRQMQFAQLLQLREAGVQIPDDMLLESSTLQNKKMLVDAVAKNTQAQQQIQQQQAQLALQEQQARIKLADARSQADIGLGHERTSRVVENIEAAKERKAAAVKDEEIALLNLVKALKEIDSIDIQQVEKYLTLANMLKEKEAQQETPQYTTTPGGPNELGNKLDLQRL
jgi:hypothetical protein